MKRIAHVSFIAFSLLILSCKSYPKAEKDTPKLSPLDSIILSDPCILADSATKIYYMTGTGGMLWKSKDLEY